MKFLLLLNLFLFVSCNGGPEDASVNDSADEFQSVSFGDVEGNWDKISPYLGEYSGSCAYDSDLNGSYDQTFSCSVNVEAVLIGGDTYDLRIEAIPGTTRNFYAGGNYSYDFEFGYFEQLDLEYNASKSSGDDVFNLREKSESANEDEFNFAITEYDTMHQGVIYFVDLDYGLKMNLTKNVAK